MQKQCQCGENMSLKLRTVIFSGKVEIDNVPIYSCQGCSRSEVIPQVKDELTGLIRGIGEPLDKQNYLFNECNEWANLLVEYKLLQKTAQTAVTQLDDLLNQRTNELLDLYLLAQSLHDQEWLDSIVKRLSQLGAKVKFS